MGTSSHDMDPREIDPLEYLAKLVDLNGDLSPSERLEHYKVLKPALLRVQSEDPATLDLALQEISKRLKIKSKTVREELSN